MGHVFGSKEVSRSMGTKAGANTGIGEGILKKMLPMVVPAAMDALSQKAAGSGMLGGPAQAQLSGLSGLSSSFNFDGDGSIAYDVLGIASKKFFGA